MPRGSLAKGGKLDFWALREQPWGSYQEAEAINPGLLLRCLLMVNRPVRCATAAGKAVSADAEYGANIHELVKKTSNPQCLN